jgi:hypothetical protein
MRIKWQDLGIVAGLLIASMGLVWAFLWWAALLFTDWRITLQFDSLGEQWIEGVLFHAIAVFGFWMAVRFSTRLNDSLTVAIQSDLLAATAEEVQVSLKGDVLTIRRREGEGAGRSPIAPAWVTPKVANGDGRSAGTGAPHPGMRWRTKHARGGVTHPAPRRRGNGRTPSPRA